MRHNRLKQALINGSIQLGTWLSMPDPLLAERVATVGWDWLLIDMEHGPIDIKTAASMMAVISKDPSAPVPLVRIPNGTIENIKQVLDAGAFGVLAPMVMTAEEAREIVAAVQYPPAGVRSVGGGRALIGFQASNAEYFAQANDEMVVVVQIEHIDAVRRVDEILAVPGIDAAFIGPSDLCASMGLTPDADQTDPVFENACQQVLEAARRHHVVAGIMVSGIEGTFKRVAQGFTMFGVSTEVNFMVHGMHQFLANLKQ